MKRRAAAEENESSAAALFHGRGEAAGPKSDARSIRKGRDGLIPEPRSSGIAAPVDQQRQAEAVWVLVFSRMEMRRGGSFEHFRP